MTDVTYILYIINKYLEQAFSSFNRKVHEQSKIPLIAKLKHIKKRQPQKKLRKASVYLIANTIPRLS